MDPLTKMRLHSQMAQMKKVSDECAEYLRWLQQNVTLPEIDGVTSGLDNVIQHQINMAAYFSNVQKGLKNQMKHKEKSLPIR